jgi:hypothetical protein
MDPWTYDDNLLEQEFKHLHCDECKKTYPIPRNFEDEQTYVYRKLQSRHLKDIKVLNLDDEAIPIAEDKASTKDEKFFVKAIITESKVGKRLVIYAGERKKKEKTQIFVEPEIKRLAFDQKDMHPSDVFLMVEATFEDGTTSTIKKKSR